MPELQSASPVLASLDLDKTLHFYQDKLGFEKDFQYPNYAGVKRGAVGIHFWLTDNPDIPKQTSCYVYMTGVDDLYAEYKTAGVIHPNGDITNQSYGMRDFAVIDGDGNLIRFGEDIS